MTKANEADLALQRQVGERIREIRTAKGISQEKLAQEIGLHRTYVGSLERGERNPSLQVISRLARLLDVTLDQLLCSKGHK
ncbi:helix-turn-helix domain-containing protein [Nocardioides daejeonensis]|uniref:helix-turn-helix domain-containing protein n=1 Tax=Nocardioides daejeonensis TaxID=1046556 RepID=UPI000D740CFF|nr:helix-turn-helix transcriptional regulator [Nocardioides daejeonensis]